MFRVNVASVSCVKLVPERVDKDDAEAGSSGRRRQRKMQRYAPNLRIRVPLPRLSTRFLLVLYFYPVSRTRDRELLKALRKRIYAFIEWQRKGNTKRRMRKWKEGRNLAPVVKSLGREEEEEERIVISVCLSVASFTVLVCPSPASPLTFSAPFKGAGKSSESTMCLGQLNFLRYPFRYPLFKGRL